jgi:hypothetical protein
MAYPGDMITPGRYVLVLSAGTLHLTGFVEASTGTPGRWWIDLNTLGTHLPQMYGEHEMTVIGPDTDVTEHGLCAACHGFGLLDDATTCPSCNGSGQAGVTVTHLVEDPATTLHSVDIDTAVTATIRCELCRSARQPVPRR